MLAAISPVVYICAMLGASSSPLRGKRLAPLGLCVHHPVLLAGGVQVVAAGRQARLDDLGSELDERADHVADHLRAAEQVGQRGDIVVDLDDVVVDGLDAGNPVQDLLDAILVPAGRGERHVVLAEVLADEPAGVPGGPIDDNGFGAHAVNLSGGSVAEVLRTCVCDGTGKAAWPIATNADVGRCR